MTALNLKHKIFDTPGYSSDLRLTPEELEVFRAAITEQWLDVIGRAHPELAAQFGEVQESPREKDGQGTTRVAWNGILEPAPGRTGQQPFRPARSFGRRPRHRGEG